MSALDPASRWVAPAAALGFGALAIACDLWRGEPAFVEALPAPGVEVPARVDRPVFTLDGPVRDPFRRAGEEASPVAPGLALRGPVGASAPPVAAPLPFAAPAASVPSVPPAASARPVAPVRPPLPPRRNLAPPEFTGTVVRDGRGYVVTAEGLVPEGRMVGGWRLISVGYAEVVAEADGRRLHLDASGRVLGP